MLRGWDSLMRTGVRERWGFREVGTMGKVTNKAVEARRRAKERRVKLYEDRAAKDERIEAAAAAFFVAQAEREDALAAVAAADASLAGQVRVLFDDEDLTQAEVAELLDIESSEVRRLSRLAAGSADGDDGATTAKSGARSAGARVEQVVGS